MKGKLLKEKFTGRKWYSYIFSHVHDLDAMQQVWQDLVSLRLMLKMKVYTCMDIVFRYVYWYDLLYFQVVLAGRKSPPIKFAFPGNLPPRIRIIKRNRKSNMNK